MDLQSITDEIVNMLLKCPKTIKNVKAKKTQKAKHSEKNYDVYSDDGAYSFTLITRQSLMIRESFSCGLLWHAASGQKIMLTRYNGSDHPHTNPIEDGYFESSCHIHKATERYIGLGRKPELYAEPSSRYKNLEEAFRCLIEDCKISGLELPSSDKQIQDELFK